MLIYNVMRFLKELDNLRKLTLINVKLGDSRKGDFYHEEKHCSWVLILIEATAWPRTLKKNIYIFLLLLQFAIPTAQCSHKIATKIAF